MPSVPPAGLTFASAFVIVEQTEEVPVAAILADAIDPKTHEYTSIEDSAEIADGMVTTLLATTRGSGAAVREFGQSWREITHSDDNTPELIEGDTRRALQPGRDAGVLRLKKASSEQDASDPSQVNHVIEYTDLLAPKVDAARRLTFSE